MMPKSFSMVLFVLCLSPTVRAQQVQVGGSFVPAGTLLHCTMDEPNFSSKTMQVGDPFLCRVGSIEMFGRPLIPRGAYLTGRFQEYKDPGHFVGKGWLQLEFDSLTLPNGNFPLHAKVISAGHYRVDGEGKIRGHGHPTRDAIEWGLPILWPIKILTLPARGPRPTLKGETRLELRLMEDMLIPDSATGAYSGLPARTSSSWPAGNNAFPSRPQGALAGGSGLSHRTDPTAGEPALTVLVLRGGRTYLVADYWVERGTLNYRNVVGIAQALPLDSLDLAMTKQVNAERGIQFALTARTR